MKLLVAIAFFLVPHASFAADEPEAVYAKFHRAAMAGDLDDMLVHGPAQQRADMQGMPAAHREAALKMVQSTMPRAFVLERKTLGTRGRATLIVSGPWDSGSGGLRPIYGTVQMLQENGVWKVNEVAWNTEKPAILSAPKPAAVAPEAAKAAASTKGAPVVGSMAAEAPGRKLGPAKPECVYKPVMTAADIENCK